MPNQRKDNFIYICPVCHEKLRLFDRSLKCINNHNYDIAREGYVNLLLANKKRSLEPGDNKEMIRHRQQFLSKGFYEPLAEQINHMVYGHFAHQQAGGSVHLLDCGCGEGYFLQRLRSSLASSKQPFSFWGIDISKFAIKSAAKRDKGINWAVASVYDLPILPDSVDYVLNIMAPQSSAELQRVLKPTGHLLMVNPGPNHLLSLRQQLYEHPREHEMPANALPGFRFVTRHQLRHSLDLRQEDITDLLVMTPYSWNVSPNVREKVMSLNHLNTEVDLVLSLFEKRL